MTGYLLDTNVVSEMTKSEPDPSLRQNLSALSGDQLWISVLTFGELNKGVSLLPLGRRRIEFEQFFRALAEEYSDRILEISLAVAMTWGALAAETRSRGFHLSQIDGLLAATALSHGLTVLTRNVRDFLFTNVPVLDPWQSGAIS
jgi:predicted nucleic acid-binding protein